jgi:pimeloyl-ACP methyl ester carboxylesterase
VDERRGEIGGLQTFWYERPSAGAAHVLYLHGVPTNADDWPPFLERTGGVAPDLPGFGRSGKPAGFDYSIGGYADWLEAFVDALGLERFSLVVHDWGAVGLALAQRRPAALERLVVCDCVPFLAGYRWHRIARIWRTPLAGELFMGLSTRWGLKQLSRPGSGGGAPLPDALVDRVWRHFDHGTQRAILKLYRSASPDVLARAGERLGELRAPALVVWGARETYLPVEFAHAYGEALDAPVHVIEGAGHWPWIDRPETIDLITGFLHGDR